MGEFDLEPKGPFVVREHRLILLSAVFISLLILLTFLASGDVTPTSQMTLQEMALAESEMPQSLHVLLGTLLIMVLVSFLWLLNVKSRGENALPDAPPERAAWRFEDIIIVFFVTAAFSQAVLLQLDGEFSTLLGVDSISKMVSVVLIFMLIERRGQQARQVLGLDLRGGLGVCLRAFACFFVFIPFLQSVNYIWQHLLRQVQGEAYEGSQEVVEQFAQSGTGYMSGLIIVAAVFVAPIAEEMFFRGFLYGFLRKHVRPSIAVVFVGALFGIFHMPLAVMLPTGLLGAFFCYLYERTGRLTVPIFLHAIYNFVQIMLIMSLNSS